MFAPRLPCGDQCPLEGARIFSQHLESIHRLFSGSMLTYNNQASEDLFKSVQFPDAETMFKHVFMKVALH